jgi:predicted ATP-dependent endonuclease of OLD family
MKISSVEIHNWRSIVHDKIDFNDLMIFIGQNNHGKSNIQNAILFFFGELNVSEQDYNNGSTDLWVEIEFSDLNTRERLTFQKYVTFDNRLKVRKSAAKTEGAKYSGYLENPALEWLQEAHFSEYTNREAIVELPITEYLPATGRITKETYATAVSRYIEENISEIGFRYELETTNFLGAKNVAKGSFGDVYFIPSIKKASEELSPKGNSVFAQLYARVIQKMSESNETFIQAKQKIKELTEILNKQKTDGSINTERPSDLSSLETLIGSELESWNTTIDIQIAPPNVDDIFKLGATVIVDDGIKTDIDRKGHGLQRALIFALIKAWSNLTHQNEELSSDSTELQRRAGSNSSYFIFEEPELFLHPQAQRELFHSLVDLSKAVSQVILCTHSSSFVDLDFYKSICIVKKDSVESGTKVLQFNDELFTDLEEKKKFNLSYWINPDRSELFFAKKVILLEGATDKSVLPLLAKRLNSFKYDYTLIDCGSKDNIPQYIRLLNNFKINYVAVYDKDHQAGKNQQAIECANNSSTAIENVILSSLGSSVIFENDIEEELGMTEKASNKAYKAISFVLQEGYEISDNMKLKIQAIYE